MNTERLAQLAEMLISSNGEYGIQNTINSLRSELDNLVDNPSHTNYQTRVSDQIRALKLNLEAFEARLNPAQRDAISEIGALPYFSSDLVAGIEVLQSQNGITPSVVRDRVAQLVSEREAYLTHLTQLLGALGALNAIAAPAITDVEVGFLIPRGMFGNELPGLSDQFRDLSRILDTFIEVSTGNPGGIELRQLSTTDPLVLVSIVTPAAIAFAAAVNWILAKAKEILELKELYDRVKLVQMPEDIAEKMKVHISESIRTALDNYAAQQIGLYSGGDEGRKNELGNQLAWAVRATYSKIEQGMTVELRLPPPEVVVGDDADGDQLKQSQYTELFELARRLEFPKVGGEPLVPLEAPPPAND